jgi:peptidoglycan/LPS O-acetylase OafA/YrhL
MAAKYRADIDGLRALAVVPVVLFHAGVSGFSGGYVGVDIFFVISGFLITSILVSELDRGTYSIASFYDRRIRRIFPALFAMLITVAVAGYVFLLPSDLTVLAQTLLGTIFFASNIVLWRKSDYFGGPAQDNPLLHTWSLGVEEQFYIFLPLLLWILYRATYQRVIPWLIASLAVMSLLLSEWVLVDHPPAAFYLLPTRAWELLIGSLLATLNIRQPHSPLFREGLAALGLGLVVAAITLYDENITFPGVNALIPCMGAALILFTGSGRPTLVSRLLSFKPIVLVGLISYSLYLWHWPLLVLPRLYLARPLTASETALAVIGAVGLAIVSLRYIERPMRKKRASSLTPVFTYAGLSMAALIVLGVGLLSGVPSRLPAKVQMLAAYGQAHGANVPGCSMKLANVTGDIGDACLDSKKAPNQPKLLLWGDSHAGQYGEAMQPIARSQGLALFALTSGGCLPLPGVGISNPSGHIDKTCERMNDAVLGHVLQDKSVKVVVLAGRWARLFFPPSEGESRSLMPLNGRQGGNSEELLVGAITNSARAMQNAGVHVIVIGQAPEAYNTLPNCLATKVWRGFDDQRCPLRPDTFPGHPFALTMLRAARAAHFTYLQPSDVICKNGECRKLFGPIPVLADSDHLTPEASVKVLQGVGFREALRRRMDTKRSSS